MAEDLEHRDGQPDDPEHPEQDYPGPDTHQSPWVAWATVIACVAFGGLIIVLNLLLK